MSARGRAARLALGGAAGLIAALLIGLLTGPAALGPGEVVAALADRVPGVSIDSGLSERELAILWEIRAPRVVLGMLVGAALAGSGAAYQGVFRNPLADPYLLGVAAGAGLGATAAIVISGPGAGIVPVAAFGGALAAVVATYGLGAAAGGRRTGLTLILAGVAVAAFLTAFQTFVQQQNADSIREVYAWILGRLGTVGWSEVWLMAPYAAVSLLTLVMHRRLLDVLSVGEEEAGTLGVRPALVRGVVVVAASLAAAAAVAVAGLIGFVGIIVPHTVRLLGGPSYRLIVPLSLVAGGAFLVLADVAARTLLSPAEIPIGVVTAFIGGPFFVLVLRTARRGVA